MTDSLTLYTHYTSFSLFKAKEIFVIRDDN